MNELNVIRRVGLIKWRYISNWPSNFKAIGRIFKYAFQRCMKGYCDVDVWSLDDYYLRLFVATLHDLKTNLHGAPSEFYDVENDSAEPWVAYLGEMEGHFARALEDQEFEVNEYEEQIYSKLCDFNLNGKWRSDPLWNKYMEREKEIDAFRKDHQNKGLDMLKEHFNDLWD